MFDRENRTFHTRVCETLIKLKYFVEKKKQKREIQPKKKKAKYKKEVRLRPYLIMPPLGVAAGEKVVKWCVAGGGDGKARQTGSGCMSGGGVGGAVSIWSRRE